MHHTEAAAIPTELRYPGVFCFCMDFRRIKEPRVVNNLAPCVFLKRGFSLFPQGKNRVLYLIHVMHKASKDDIIGGSRWSVQVYQNSENPWREAE